MRRARCLIAGKGQERVEAVAAFVENVNLYTALQTDPKVRLEQTKKNTPIKLLQVKAFDTSAANLISKQTARVTASADRAKTVKSTAKPLSNILTDSAPAVDDEFREQKEWIVIDIQTLANIKRIELVQEAPYSARRTCCQASCARRYGRKEMGSARRSDGQLCSLSRVIIVSSVHR